MMQEGAKLRPGGGGVKVPNFRRSGWNPPTTIANSKRALERSPNHDENRGHTRFTISAVINTPLNATPVATTVCGRNRGL